MENLKDQLESQNFRINDLDAETKLLKSGRDEFKKLYDSKIKKIDELRNEIQKLKDLKAQEAMTANLSKLNKFDLEKPFIHHLIYLQEKLESH